MKLSMLQTQSFEPRDIVDVLKCLPEKDLLEQLEVRAVACMVTAYVHVVTVLLWLIHRLSRAIKKGTMFPGFLHIII